MPLLYCDTSFYDLRNSMKENAEETVRTQLVLEAVANDLGDKIKLDEEKIKETVKNGTKSWQAFYEDWVILGEEDKSWDIYKEKNNISDVGNKKLDDLLTTSNIKTIIDYVKKINPDTLSKTLNTVQKVLQITQSFGSKPNPGLYNANYNSWWD